MPKWSMIMIRVPQYIVLDPNSYVNPFRMLRYKPKKLKLKAN